MRDIVGNPGLHDILCGVVLRETTFQVSGIPWLEIDINLVIVMKTVMLGILMVLMMAPEING